MITTVTLVLKINIPWAHSKNTATRKWCLGLTLYYLILVSQVLHCDNCRQYAARKTSGFLQKKQFCLQCANKIPKGDWGRLCDVTYVPNVTTKHQQKHRKRKITKVQQTTQPPPCLKLNLKEIPLCVVQIQRIWRGSRGRKSSTVHAFGRKLWLTQRAVDDQRRMKLCYQIACFFGRGSLLESDTPRESVIKKVPYWSRVAVEDIIRDRLISLRDEKILHQIAKY